MATTKKSTKKKQDTLRDIVVIGASAGGILALPEITKHLPANFPGTIFVVQHLGPYSESVLPQIINLNSALPAQFAKDGEKFLPGNIYVAPPDHHLILEKGTMVVSKGPKENRFRPSIDALFRSAAYVYGNRVVGVVLTGYLDDGTSGLWSVQRLGGVTVVQDPSDAAVPDMPANALQFVEADHVVPLAQLASLLTHLTTEEAPAPPNVPQDDLNRLEIEIAIARHDNAFEMGIIDKGELTAFTCPDCHGALTKLIEGNLIRFRCHTGHAYTISSLLAEVTESVESLLYQAMRGLEETKMLLENMGTYFTQTKQPDVAALFQQKAEETGQQARVVHDSIFVHEKLSGDLQFQKKKLR
ncbi:chemotaxis protein CheB [Rufibacter quisquiliarum]|uniref:protein-glutamate methylesterase n=1 Tax=Rufibacter quisquiliarum TaxID=1549639 RepID=A0A839GFA0_9BACT|nr:chemotaxis protein CheB [Rufibacter quisquiliarum]MBA9077190.1 two-component system chemotaxis response regulator CheB [Rufibacter quisquiliarum]